MRSISFVSMDGLEIAATTICGTDDCPVCEVPKDELDRTDVSYPLWSVSAVRAQVAAAQAALLEPDGSVKLRCIGRASTFSYDIPRTMYAIPRGLEAEEVQETDSKALRGRREKRVPKPKRLDKALLMMQEGGAEVNLIRLGNEASMDDKLASELQASEIFRLVILSR